MNQKKPNRRLSMAALKKGVTTKKGKRTAKKVAKTFFTILVTILLIFVVTAGVLAGVAAIYVTNYAQGSADEMDLYQLKYNQNQTSIVYAYDNENNLKEITRLHGEENRIWVDSEQISPYMSKAFIAIEDERFYEHHGVDWKRTISAFANMFLSFYDSTQGGSTITQQLIKNVTKEDDVTIVRKVNEIFTALELEKLYDKDTIIEAYMNEVYLGAGAYGVQAAAETYFGKNAADLNIAECATIAAVTQYPYKNDPLSNPEGNRERQEYCLKKMLELGFINQEEYQQAMDYKLILTNSPEYTGSTATEPEEETEDEYQSFYVDYIIESVRDDLQEEYGMSGTEAINMIYSGGLRIYSAVDLDVQAAMENVFTTYDGVSLSDGTDINTEDAKAQAAMVVMEYDGRIAGLVGQAGQKAGNRCLNRATGAVRQPGSAIKPLSIYAPAVEYDLITWSMKFPDQPIIVPGEGRWPTNFSKTYGADTTVQHALEESLNTVPARILQKMSIDTSYTFMTDKLHFTTLDEANDRTYSSLATGGTYHGVTVLEMTAGFQIFGNGGIYNEPYCYYEIRNSKDEVILSHSSNPETAIDSDTATVMNRMLQTVVTSGTAGGYGVRGQSTFAKTGTTSDTKDRYFMGGTPYYVGGCWYGFDTPKAIRASGNPAGKIWREVMNDIHSDLSRKSFSSSSGVTTRTYCLGSGLIASENCASTATGWYKTSNVGETCAGGDACWANESRPDLLPSGTIPSSSEAVSSTPQTPSTTSSQTPSESTSSENTTSTESSTSSSNIPAE